MPNKRPQAKEEQLGPTLDSLTHRHAFGASLYGDRREVEAAIAEFRRRQAATGPLLPLEDYARRREAAITRRMRAKELRFLCSLHARGRHGEEEFCRSSAVSLPGQTQTDAPTPAADKPNQRLKQKGENDEKRAAGRG
jgi:hypothetical protein